MNTKTSSTAAEPEATAKPVIAQHVGETDEPVLAKPLSEQDVATVLKLAKGASSIELKLSVPLSGHRATIESIGLDPVEAQPRQAFFFDTPDLALYKAGVVVRARRI